MLVVKLIFLWDPVWVVDCDMYGRKIFQMQLGFDAN